MNTIENKLQAFKEILEIMDELRKNCPWDKEQTIESLRTMTIEETYELSEAICEKDYDSIKKEIGDLFFHTIFYSKVASEQNKFDIADVIKSLSEKLKYRHPHVFGNTTVNNKDDVKENWEELKLKEKGGNNSVLGGIPKALPAMVKAIRIQEKVRGVGFDWDKKEQVWEKVIEEINEFSEEIRNNDKEKMENEFGDIFFALINAARLYGINPENALERTNRKFTSRFNYLENMTISKGLSLKKMSLAEMDVYWDEAKKNEKTDDLSDLQL